MILFICTACPYDEFYGFMLENNLSENIAYCVGVNKDRQTIYPDTLLHNKEDLRYFNERSNISFWQTRDKKWDYILKNSDTISIFIFSVDTLEKYTWDQIKSGYKVIIRYDLSYSNIRQLNYVIPYPPNESMRNMKMYPKYFKD